MAVLKSVLKNENNSRWVYIIQRGATMRSELLKQLQNCCTKTEVFLNARKNSGNCDKESFVEIVSFDLTLFETQSRGTLSEICLKCSK